VSRYLDTWAPFRGGRSVASRGDEHLFLGDLRIVTALAAERNAERPDEETQ
jgi:hypothetical protein